MYMARERIIQGDLSEGSGVEGSRKKRMGEFEEEKTEDDGSKSQEMKKDTKKQFRRPQFKTDSEADIFDTRKE